jgi:hypothetical protein
LDLGVLGITDTFSQATYEFNQNHRKVPKMKKNKNITEVLGVFELLFPQKWLITIYVLPVK